MPTPKTYDISGGSTNKYEASSGRHGIPFCPHCSAGSIIKMDGAQFHRWFMLGEHIQNAAPSAPADIREIFITGVHPECWDAFVGPEPTGDTDG